MFRIVLRVAHNFLFNSHHRFTSFYYIPKNRHFLEATNERSDYIFLKKRINDKNPCFVFQKNVILHF